MRKIFIFAVVIIIIIPLAVVFKVIHYNPQLTTTIYDTNGKKIANLFDKQDRFYVSFNKIPARMIEAIVATEDTTFFENPGINVSAMFRALIKDLRAHKIVEGASTLTQQLIKNVLLTPKKTISRKIHGIISALLLERSLSKDQIITRYLNQVVPTMFYKECMIWAGLINKLIIMN